ncbi:MAG: hypothetical protein ACYTGB_15310, partial [Planctomycetota bacterium]
MFQRALIPVLAVLCLMLSGCSKGGGKAPAAAGGPAAPQAGAPAEAPPAEAELVEVFATGAGDTELEKICVKYVQLRKLMRARNLRYRTIAALGWEIHNKSRELVAEYNFKTRPSSAQKLADDKKGDQPESDWAKLPRDVRELDLVAINARRLALAAGTLDGRKLGESYSKLKLIADRCLPVPAERVPLPAPAPEVVEPEPEAEPVLPGSEKAPVPGEKGPETGEKAPPAGEKKDPAPKEPKVEPAPAPAETEKTEKAEQG